MTDQPLSPSTTSPIASGRRSSSSTRRPRPSTATSATPTASRIPAPAGRAQTRALMEQTARGRRRGDPDRRPLDRGPDHPRHAPGHRRAAHRGGRPGPPPARRRRPDGRTAAAPAAADPVPAGRHARAPRGVPRAAARLPGVHGRQRGHPARGPGQRPDGAARSSPSGRSPRSSGCSRSRSTRRSSRRSAQVASDADRERIREVVRDDVYPADARLPRRAARRVPARQPRGAGHLVRARTASQIYRTAIRSWTTLEHGPARDPRDRPGRARVDRGRAARDRPGRRLRRRHRGLPAVPRRPTPGTRPGPRTSWSPGPREDIERAMAAAPQLLRAPAPGRLRGPRGRGVQGEGRAVRLLLPAVARTARAKASTTRTATTCRRASTPSSPRRPTTRRRPGHHFQITLEMENPHLNTFRRLGVADGRRRLRRGLGPVQRAAGRRDGPLPERGRAVRDARRARPGAPRGSSSTPGCTRCAGRASARSTSCATTPACPRPTRSSRPTATSAGRARR